VQALKQNTFLKQLYFAGKIERVDSFEWIENLIMMICVAVITKSDVGLSDEGANQIADLIKTNTSIHTLSLSNFLSGNANSMTDIGGTAILEALPFNSSLMTLSLEDNKLSDELMGKIEAELKSSNRYDLVFCA